MTSTFEPNPRRHHLRGMTAGVMSASPEDESKLEAKIVSEIRAQIPDPLAQDKAIALALERIHHMSPAEIAHVVASFTQAELAANIESRSINEGVAHYRDDGVYVDERGNVEFGTSRSGEFMPSTNNIFYGQNGKLKSYDEGWNAWSSRYGRGELGNTGFSSHDVYTGVYYGKKYYPTQAGLQKLFAISEIAAQQPGTEITTQAGKKVHITPEQIENYIDQKHISNSDADKIASDPQRRAEFEKGLYRETTIANGGKPDSSESGRAAGTLVDKASGVSQVMHDLPKIPPKDDAKQTAVQAPTKTMSPAP